MPLPLGALLGLAALVLAAACQPAPPPPSGDATPPAADGVEGEG